MAGALLAAWSAALAAGCALRALSRAMDAMEKRKARRFRDGR